MIDGIRLDIWIEPKLFQKCRPWPKGLQPGLEGAEKLFLISQRVCSLNATQETIFNRLASLLNSLRRPVETEGRGFVCSVEIEANKGSEKLITKISLQLVVQIKVFLGIL